jgi:O-antigen/teichoic acid export membrane protein
MPSSESQDQIIVPVRSLKLNCSWMLAGNLIYSASQWGILTVLAKLGSPEMVGKFAMGIAVSAPIIMFSNLQLRQVQATDARGKYLFTDYLGLRLFATTIAWLVIIGVACIGRYGVELGLVIIAVGLAKALESLSDVYFGLFQQHERMDLVARSIIMKGIVSVICVGVVIYVTRSVLWGVLAMAGAYALRLFLFDMGNARQVLASINPALGKSRFQKPSTNVPILLEIAKLAVPLGVCTLLLSLNVNIPRYFIEHFGGVRQLGYFAATSYIMVVGSTIASALGQSVCPRLAKYYAARRLDDFRSLTLKLLGLGIVMGIVEVGVVALAGKKILTILYKPDYASTYKVFILVAIASAIADIGSFLSYGMTAARQFKVQVPIAAISLALTIPACAVFIPRYGLYGAGLSLIVCSTVQAAGGAWVNKRAMDELRGDPS